MTEHAEHFVGILFAFTDHASPHTVFFMHGRLPARVDDGAYLAERQCGTKVDVGTL
jgi:hypothetical protein